VLPLRPRTRAAYDEASLHLTGGSLEVVDPVGYLDMVVLEQNARVIATDSGGVQKEAYFYGVPCVTLRDETEWVELVEAGAKVLTGADPDLIVPAILGKRPPLKDLRQIYGDGNAAGRITMILGRKEA
jgi:UDP-GlcNAc3NAcA epimerase